MKMLIGVLALIFGTLFAIVIINGNSLNSDSGMDISGNKFPTIDLEKFGKGKEARICPVSGLRIMPKDGEEVVLSNGKKIVVCCLDCKPAIEKNLNKYESLMY